MDGARCLVRDVVLEVHISQEGRWLLYKRNLKCRRRTVKSYILGFDDAISLLPLSHTTEESNCALERLVAATSSLLARLSALHTIEQSLRSVCVWNSLNSRIAKLTFLLALIILVRASAVPKAARLYFSFACQFRHQITRVFLHRQRCPPELGDPAQFQHQKSQNPS
mmetsp:Transcript_25312/g.52667  ORF Transcript_25312/g.52667 Transcript_25312/m.52667 type:complete len:167 (+) Transcript_25312:1036-1536(+)